MVLRFFRLLPKQIVLLLVPSSSMYFGTRKCCHPQISDLVFWLHFFRKSSKKIISILTSRLPSCASSFLGWYASYECISKNVKLCKKISTKRYHREVSKTKFDICGWQHLWGPKDGLNFTLHLIHPAPVVVLISNGLRNSHYNQYETGHPDNAHDNHSR